MRKTPVLLVALLVGLAGNYPSAQTTRQMGAFAVRDEAPTDVAIDLTDEDLLAVANVEMLAKNLATTRLLEGGYYSVNIRRLSGPETAHFHPTSLTIYVVREGTGTLVTGGTIVDTNGQPITSGRTGHDIKGGIERKIKPGDIIVTPPGVPHFMSQVDGHMVFMNLIFEQDVAADTSH